MHELQRRITVLWGDLRAVKAPQEGVSLCIRCADLAVRDFALCSPPATIVPTCCNQYVLAKLHDHVDWLLRSALVRTAVHTTHAVRTAFVLKNQQRFNVILCHYPKRHYGTFETRAAPRDARRATWTLLECGGRSRRLSAQRRAQPQGQGPQALSARARRAPLRAALAAACTSWHAAHM